MKKVTQKLRDEVDSEEPVKLPCRCGACRQILRIFESAVTEVASKTQVS
jgi:hypothetical protein